MTDLNRNEAKKKKNLTKIFKMADLKKLSFSTATKNWAIFTIISEIGPWVSRINWCEGHWFCSTYVVDRLSVILLKTLHFRLMIIFWQLEMWGQFLSSMISHYFIVKLVQVSKENWWCTAVHKRALTSEYVRFKVIY